MTGTYQQGTTGTFTADLTSAPSQDLLDAGTADLGGTLALHLAQAKSLSPKTRALVHAVTVKHPFAVITGLGALGGRWKRPPPPRESAYSLHPS